MKKSDLHREWARVLDMCEGTKVDPNVCWGFWGNRTDQGAPEFIQDPERYEFAVAILEDKPVFVGDKIYSKIRGGMVTVTGPISNSGYYSWNPPKKTFMLNGEELPCPDGNKGGYQISLLNGRHYFSNFHDAQKVANAFDKLLSDNTK